MTKLLKTHKYQLRIRIDSDAPYLFLNKWFYLRKKIETETEYNEMCCNDVLKYCKLETNKNLKKSNACEGGFCCNCANINCKQIRFRMMLFEHTYLDNTNDIVLDVFDSNIHKWTIEELDDLIDSFVKVCSKYLNTNTSGNAKCVNGCIEMIRMNESEK